MVESRSGKAFNDKLDNLHAETKKLLSLLDDRQPGLLTWCELFFQKLRSTHRIIHTMQPKETP